MSKYDLYQEVEIIKIIDKTLDKVDEYIEISDIHDIVKQEILKELNIEEVSDGSRSNN